MTDPAPARTDKPISPEEQGRPSGIPYPQAFIKRAIDIIGAALGLAATWWIILPVIWAARLDTGQSGIFIQSRVGRRGKPFTVYKICTMRPCDTITTNVTIDADIRITNLGRILRWSKLDELPQLWNVLRGDMSFVGPRPDVEEAYDMDQKDVQVVLSVRPGITGPATLKYRNEQTLLAEVANPEQYNAEVIFPDKLRINRRYVENYRLRDDFVYVYRTLFG